MIGQLPTLFYDDLYSVPLKSSMEYRETLIFWDVKTGYHRHKAVLFPDTHKKILLKASPMYLGSTTQTKSLEVNTIRMVSLFKVEDDEVHPKNLTQHNLDLPISTF